MGLQRVVTVHCLVTQEIKAWNLNSFPQPSTGSIINAALTCGCKPAFIAKISFSVGGHWLHLLQIIARGSLGLLVFQVSVSPAADLGCQSAIPGILQKKHGPMFCQVWQPCMAARITTNHHFGCMHSGIGWACLLIPPADFSWASTSPVCSIDNVLPSLALHFYWLHVHRPVKPLLQILLLLRGLRLCGCRAVCNT